MSLNGLDDPKVKEAHESAVAEPGGWFLLKYASRDDVELLGRGNGGIVEIRNQIAQYENENEDHSPLFGFLRYRRRNVIIKYLPEDCSRLVQARVTVHFNAVCERFTPYNTTFSIATAKELKDTKLSAACSLHAASGSTSSSTSSLRRRRLMEIAEEEEEEQRASKRKSVGEGLPETPGEASAETPKSPIAGPPVTLNADLANSPEESKFSESLEPPEFVGTRPSSPTKSVDEGRRLSSQSTRPEVYSSFSTYGKPRVKLAPRPSLDVAGHPRTAAVGADFRPISQLPSGFKLFSKGAKKGKSKENTLDPSEPAHLDETTEISLAATAIPLPEEDPISQLDEPVRPHTSSERPTTSSGASIKSAMPSLTTTAVTATKQTMTPEKARLMKAMKLREKKKRMSIQPMSVPVIDIDVDADADVDGLVEEINSEKVQPTEHIEEITEQTLATEVDGDNEEESERRLSISKADSGIVVDASSASIHTDAASEITQTDSHPASPIIASSEPDHSTTASSLSESTDGTVKDIEDESQQELFNVKFDMAETENPHDLVVESEILAEVAATEDTLLDLETETDVPVAKETGQTLPPSNEEKIVEKIEVTIEPEQDDTPLVEQAIEAIQVEEQPREEQLLEAQQNEVHLEIEKAEIKETESKSPISLPISKFSTSPTQEKAPVVSPLQSPKGETKEEGPVKATVSGTTEGTPKSPISPRSPGLKVPRSKFSTQDLRAAASEVPTIISPAEEMVKEPLPAPIEEHSDGDAQSADSERSKRKALVDPIRTDLGTSEKQQDVHTSDDEELMNELDSATVEQAHHITVSKSPITPVFPSPTVQQASSRPTSRGVVRTISNPIRGNLLTPADVAQSQSQRSISSGAAFLHKITQQNQNLSTKQPGKIGSSISQRIKALEKLSATPPGSTDSSESSLKAPRPSSAFFSVKRGSVRETPSRSPSVMERTNSLRVPSPAPSALDDSRDSSPETAKANRGRSGSMANRLSMFEVPGAQPPRGRPESISVTARIIRDPSQVGKAPELPKDPSEFGRLELKESPLVVDHQKAEPPLPPANLAKVEVSKETLQERRLSKEKRRSQSTDPKPDADEGPRRSSLSIMKDFIKDRRKSLTSPSAEVLTAPLPMSPGSKSPSRPPSTHQSSAGFGRRLSISSRRSSFSKDNNTSGALSPSTFTECSGSGDDSKSTTSDKKKSRASRFMRRLSSSLSSTGRGKTMTPTAISPTVQEEDASEVKRLQQPTIDFLGDVNVQFPDNLLWKRRSMSLDSQGFLILSAVAGSAATKDRPSTGAGVKRYHLSDFRMPYIPDVEVQELPNSVVLDFIEGSGLQVACEDRVGQMNVLHILQDAHQSHSSFGQ
ncbi:gpi-anchored cell surface glycoprotein [Colletotrichum truncatum]|uniref:Gpi-anchored cell surface glycoprotein n=1 Tax=Colletotrichum truncatum TaxID=5467 RepID=A0ACC3YHL5_COLTU|nr:gpi-anchored cell surface glycoprotein [Colletotrichum truncatum]KAF6792939.1 gpi-anchored cell surface glycoprotein [Colletotrichum truncatum]